MTKYRDHDVKIGSAVVYKHDDEYGTGEVSDIDYNADTASVRTANGCELSVSRDDLARISHDSLRKF